MECTLKNLLGACENTVKHGNMLWFSRSSKNKISTYIEKKSLSHKIRYSLKHVLQQLQKLSTIATWMQYFLKKKKKKPRIRVAYSILRAFTLMYISKLWLYDTVVYIYVNLS